MGLNITVGDENDSPPQFQSLPYIIHVNETAAVGTILHHVLALDQDVAQMALCDTGAALMLIDTFINIGVHTEVKDADSLKLFFIPRKFKTKGACVSPTPNTDQYAIRSCYAIIFNEFLELKCLYIYRFGLHLMFVHLSFDVIPLSWWLI